MLESLTVQMENFYFFLTRGLPTKTYIRDFQYIYGALYALKKIENDS